MKNAINKLKKTLAWAYLITLIALAVPFVIAGFFFHLAKVSFLEGGENLFDMCGEAAGSATRL